MKEDKNMISANDLRELSFTEAESGYSAEEVNSAINDAASTVEAYERENKELYHKLEVLAAKIEEYRAEEDSIKTALITAQKMADRIKKESKEAAEKLIADSRATADTTVEEANAKADKIVSEARDYSAGLIKQRTEEADKIVAEAEKKSNEAINSSQIVAQNILDQAKEISDELVQKSQEEKEAYAILNSTLRRNAAVFIDNLKNLYSEQLDALNNAKLYSSDEEAKLEELDGVRDEIDSLVGEIDEMKTSIPSEVKVEIPPVTPIEDEISPDQEVFEGIIEEPVQAPVSEDEPDEEAEETPAEEFTAEEEPAQESEYEEISIDDDAPDADESEEEEETPAAETEEPLDPMEAVEAFSADTITPIDKSKPAVFEITEEPVEEEKSLFEEKLPFENYFNVKTEDAHLDKTQTISLIPPDDDDDDDAPKFKGFFKKKR